MRWPQSLRARLTLWYTLVLGEPLVAFAAASFLVLDRALLHRADAFIDETLGAFTTELASEQHEEATAALAIQAALADVRFREVQLAVYDSSGTLVASSHADSTVGSAVHHPVDLVDLGTELGRRGVAARELFTVGSGDLAYRIAAEPATVQSLYTGWIMILSAVGPIMILVSSLLFASTLGFTSAFAVRAAVAAYVNSLVVVALLALIVDALAPSFGGTKDYVRSLKLVAYSFTEIITIIDSCSTFANWCMRACW